MFNVTNIKSVLRVQQLCVSNKSLNLKGNPMLSPPDCLQIAWDKEIPGNFVSGVRDSEISGKGISQQKNYQLADKHILVISRQKKPWRSFWGFHVGFPLYSCYFYYYCYHNYYHNYHVECRTKLISQLQTIVSINTHIRHITLNKYSINNSIKLADLSNRLINQSLNQSMNKNSSTSKFFIRHVTLNSSNILTQQSIKSPNISNQSTIHTIVN